MGKRERRINQIQFEIRTLDDGKTIILEGYALKFGKRSEDFGGVDEILERGCLDKTDMSNVVALINHDPNYPLARNTVREGPGHLETWSPRADGRDRRPGSRVEEDEGRGRSS